jgi:hypothetical protein
MKTVESPISFTEIEIRCFLDSYKAVIASFIPKAGLRLRTAISYDKNKGCPPPPKNNREICVRIYGTTQICYFAIIIQLHSKEQCHLSSLFLIVTAVPVYVISIIAI